MPQNIDHLLEVLYSRSKAGAESLKRNEFVCSDPYVLHEIIQDLLQNCQIPNAPAMALDLGCGNGIPCCIFSALGYEAYGIDLDQSLIQAARETSQICEKLFPTFDKPKFATGNYYPPDIRQKTKPDRHVLLTDTEDPYLELDAELGEFDIHFCYAWPGQIESIHDTFNTYAKKGAKMILIAMQETLMKHDPQKTKRNVPRFIQAGIEPETQTPIYEHYNVFEKI